MLAPFAAKAADTGPSALPSGPSTVATITLDTDAGVTDCAPQALATETTPDDTIVTEPVATEPVAEPLAAEPRRHRTCLDRTRRDRACRHGTRRDRTRGSRARRHRTFIDRAPRHRHRGGRRAESSKRELRTTMGASGGETGKAGVSRSAVGKKGEPTTLCRVDQPRKPARIAPIPAGTTPAPTTKPARPETILPGAAAPNTPSRPVGPAPERGPPSSQIRGWGSLPN